MVQRFGGAMKSRPTFIIDDDDSVLDSLSVLLESAGYAPMTFTSPETFLAEADPSAGHCLISDIKMPGMDGLALQAELAARRIVLPLIFITAHGDVSLAVKALRAGAVDFFEKPFDQEAILDSVANAVSEAKTARASTAAKARAAAKLARLTPREKEVFDQIVLGRSNKVAAHELAISPRTVEIHRAHILKKMEARSLSDLVRLSLAADEGLNV